MTAEATIFPSFTRHSRTPPLAPGPEGGVAIASAPFVYLASAGAFPLHGVFLVPKKDAAQFAGHLQDAVVVLLRAPCPQTRGVGEGLLLFDDDLIDEGDWVRGYFNLDLFAHFGLEKEPGRYWISASILGRVSPVVTVEVVPGRAPAS